MISTNANGLLLALLVALGSALCWIPFSLDPGLDIPGWIALLLVALFPGLATILKRELWPIFLPASCIGIVGGLCFTSTVWPPADPIARSLLPYAVGASVIVGVVASLIVTLIGRKIAVPAGNARVTVWVILTACVVFGPVALMLTPPLVAQRVRSNDRVAGERFMALKKAVELTAAGGADSAMVCDGSELKRHYAGPSFSDDEWQRITGNYVKENGYMFMVYCHEKNGYTIDVRPDRERGDGTRQFCTDELKKVGCRVEWNRSRYACLPCNR